MFDIALGAHEALNTANEVLGNKLDPKEVIVEGRKYRHWSFYFLLLGATAGAVATLVASILTIYTLIAAGVILFVTNSVGAYYIRKFDQLRDLEDYVNILSVRIHEMADQVKTLKGLKNELNDTANKLDQNVKDTVKVWNKGAADVKKQTDDLDKTRLKLEETEKRLRIYRDLYENLSKSVGAFSNNVADFNTSNKLFDNKISKLTDEVAKHQEVVNSLHRVDVEMDKNAEVYKNLNQANMAFLKSFQDQLIKISSYRHEAEALRETIEKRSKSVHEASIIVRDALERVIQLSKEEEKQNAQFEKQVEIINQFQKQIGELIHHRE